MSRLQKGILLGVVVLGVYLGMKVLVGTRVAGHLDNVTAQLIEHEYFQVNRMDYEHGLFSGRLDYDLVYRPPAGSPSREVLNELREDGTLNVTGSMDVVHGPWLPGSGFGLAQGEIDIALPDQVRPALPQYPANEPLVALRVISGFDGRTTVDARVIDYQGQLGSPGEPVIGELTLAGLRGEVAVPASMDAVTGHMELERLHLQERESGVEFELRAVESAVDLQRMLPLVWAGRSSLGVERVQVASDGERFRMDGLAMEGMLDVEDEWLDSRMTLEFEAIQVMDLELGPARLQASAERIDAAAYSELMAASDPVAMQGGTMNMANLPDITERLLAGGPRLRIDELGISLADEYDTHGNLSVAYDGPARLAMFDLEQLSRSFTVEMGAATTEAALERVIAGAVAIDRPQAPDSELERETDRVMQQLLETMTGFGVRHDDEGNLSLEVALLDGQLTINGEPSSIEELSRSLMSARPTPSSRPAPTGGSPAAVAVQRGANISLVSGFTPDPHTLAVTAGGNEAAGDSFGSHCSGYTVPDSANVVLDYEAGSFPLYISARSSSDTTLAVMSPDGSFHCNDDFSGLDPALSFEEPETGTYRIWVGTYQSGQADAELSISELEP